MCNGCERITCCQLQKQYYYADFAQQEYEAVRSESRQGIATAPEELRRIDAVISPLIKQGQSIHHICSTHADEIMLNEKTIYNYMDASFFWVGNLDLPRKVRKNGSNDYKAGTYNSKMELNFSIQRPCDSGLQMRTFVL